MHDRIVGAALPSVGALAYLGDAYHSLYVRRMLVMRGLTRSKDLNAEALRYITAENQAKMYKRIESLLLEDEREVYRRAFNSQHLNKPKHASGAEYRAATGFEAIVGMLYWIGDEKRLVELLEKAHTEEKNDTEN